MSEYSRMAKGKFTSTGAAKVINLPFQPDFVEMINYTAAATPANHGIPMARWDANMGQGFAIIDIFNATPVLVMDSVDSNGISTFSAGLALQFGTKQTIIGATAANPIVFNVTAHGYAVGDIVVFENLFQSTTTGMPQICGIPFRVSAVTDSSHFSVVWPGAGSNYTALSGTPVINGRNATVKKVLYPFLYAPGVSYIEAITLSSSTTVVTTTPHNLVTGQEVAFRIPSDWGTTELNSLPNSSNPGSPIYGYVTSVTDTVTVVVNINSASYTAFTTNLTVAGTPGRSFAQMVAVGDVNTGGVAISSGSALYPPPSVNGADTINGPAIRGAFVNNTSQGFIIGAGTAQADASSVLVGANSDVIYWRAFLSDISIP